jgi:ribonuclease HI
MGLSKDKAAEDFQLWLERQPPDDIVAYSDGSKPNRWSSKAGYGFAVFRGKDLVAQGKGHFAFAEVFDAEAEGAWQALRTAVAIAEQAGGQRPDITVCTDNTGVVSSINGTASASSQAAFLKFQRTAEQYRGKVTVKWVPGHCDIQGNELADKLAKEGVEAEHGARVISQPTLAYVKRTAKAARTRAFRHWWLHHQPGSYKDTGLLATLGPTAELQQLGRPMLHRLLAARSGHGDFADYHKRFGHADVSVKCSCGRQKSPSHIFYCRKLANRESQVGFCRRKVAEEIGEKWQMFVERVKTTDFFSRVCPR